MLIFRSHVGVLIRKERKEGKKERIKTKSKQRHKETFEGDRYFYDLDYSHSNTSVYICPNSPNYIH